MSVLAGRQQTCYTEALKAPKSGWGKILRYYHFPGDSHWVWLQERISVLATIKPTRPISMDTLAESWLNMHRVQSLVPGLEIKIKNWHSALTRLRQEDEGSEASLSYILRSCLQVKLNNTVRTNLGCQLDHICNQLNPSSWAHLWGTLLMHRLG